MIRPYFDSLEAELEWSRAYIARLQASSYKRLNETHATPRWVNWTCRKLYWAWMRLRYRVI